MTLGLAFPGEVFISLAVDALDAAAIERDSLLAYEDLRERHLAECHFRGRDNKKIQFAVSAIGATRGGIEPDLLDEVVLVARRRLLVVRRGGQRGGHPELRRTPA